MDRLKDTLQHGNERIMCETSDLFNLRYLNGKAYSLLRLETLRRGKLLGISHVPHEKYMPHVLQRVILREQVTSSTLLTQERSELNTHDHCVLPTKIIHHHLTSAIPKYICENAINSQTQFPNQNQTKVHQRAITIWTTPQQSISDPTQQPSPRCVAHNHFPFSISLPSFSSFCFSQP